MHRDQFAVEQVLPGGIMSGVSSALAAPYPAAFWKGRRLLWVDDSEALLALYKAVFEGLGFEVLAISSAREALDFISSDAADLAILDYDMPEMNGGELASVIKDRFPALPIILYTGSTRIPDAVRCCVDALCAKTGPREELLTTIERLTRETVTSPNQLSSFPERAAAQQV
jgi:CheY-like chemotaxis protein